MGKHQHNSLRLAVILLFITSIAGCSSSGTLRSDYDPGADFGAYQTWNFMEDAGPDYEGYESLFTQYMLEAITIEMDKRGYVKSENPDLLVNFNAYVQDKTKVTQTSRGAATAMVPKPACHNIPKARSTSISSMRTSTSLCGRRWLLAASRTKYEIIFDRR